MFTVLICGKAFITRLREDYSYILDILNRSPDCALCPWDPQAATLQQALPTLKDAIAGKAAWRAVVVQDRDLLDPACIDRQNPFDPVGALSVLQDFGEQEVFAKLGELAEMKDADTDEALSETHHREEERIRRTLEQLVAQSAEKIAAFRTQKVAHYGAAVNNPLTRLAIWLLGSPMEQKPRASVAWPQELLEPACPVDLAYYERLADHGLMAYDVEQVRVACRKHETLAENGLTGSLLPIPPATVLVIGERLSRRADDVYHTAWKHHEELEYSNFCDDNLYPDGMRFVLYDVAYQNEVCSAEDYLAFVTFTYLLVENDVPEGAMRSQRVYNGRVCVDTDRVRRFFTKYLQKLEVTRRLLVTHLRRQEYNDARHEPLAPEEAMETFESDVEIPVEIRSVVDKESLMAKKDVGLSKDCPRDEYDYWYGQVREINKRFLRYLREPRRALHHATRHSFRDQSIIEDERIHRLNEDQLEDIDYRLLEEEQKMVETGTPRLFVTKEYTARIDKADQEVRRVIEHRMTRKKTVIAALIAVAAYLFGFLPLLFDNTQNPVGIAKAWMVTGIAVGALMLIGFAFLWFMRKRLRDRITHFNKEMSGILGEIHNGLQAFSRYLMHACNVRREFSVFRYLERDTRRKQNILKKHIHDVEEQIHGVNALFATSIAPDAFIGDEVTPYDFDFTQPGSYVYEVPYEDADTKVEFIQMGHTVTASVDYVHRVTLTREELYD